MVLEKLEENETTVNVELLLQKNSKNTQKFTRFGLGYDSYTRVEMTKIPAKNISCICHKYDKYDK